MFLFAYPLLNLLQLFSISFIIIIIIIIIIIAAKLTQTENEKLLREFFSPTTTSPTSHPLTALFERDGTNDLAPSSFPPS
jgi:hypothetical protein